VNKYFESNTDIYKVHSYTFINYAFKFHWKCIIYFFILHKIILKPQNCKSDAAHLASSKKKQKKQEAQWAIYDPRNFI